MARAGQGKSQQKKTAGRTGAAKTERSSKAPKGRPEKEPETGQAGFWQTFIGHPAGRFCAGILGTAAVLGIILLAVGDQFDLFYKITGILILLAGVIFWLYHSLTKGREEAGLAETGDED